MTLGIRKGLATGDGNAIGTATRDTCAGEAGQGNAARGIETVEVRRRHGGRRRDYADMDIARRDPVPGCVKLDDAGKTGRTRQVAGVDIAVRRTQRNPANAGNIAGRNTSITCLKGHALAGIYRTRSATDNNRTR